MSQRVISPSGPAYVPPEKEWPPVEWGDTLPWEERVRRWREQPAKERRAYPGERQMADPFMPLLTTIQGLGEVRWSNGHGRWPQSRFSRSISRPSGMLKRGYWLYSDNGRGGFLGETIDEAHDTMRKVLTGHAECLKIHAVKQAFALESELKRKIGELNAAAEWASAAVGSLSDSFRKTIADFEASSKERVLDEMITALASPTVEASSSSSA